MEGDAQAPVRGLGLKDVAEVIARAKQKKEEMDKERGAEDAATKDADARTSKAVTSGGGSEEKRDKLRREGEKSEDRRSKHSDGRSENSRERRPSKSGTRHRSRSRSASRRSRSPSRDRRRRSKDRHGSDRRRDDDKRRDDGGKRRSNSRDRDYGRNRDRSRDRFDRYDDRSRYRDRDGDRDRERGRDGDRDYGRGRDGGRPVAEPSSRPSGSGGSVTDLMSRAIGMAMPVAAAPAPAVPTAGLWVAGARPSAAAAGTTGVPASVPMDVSQILAKLQTAAASTAQSSASKIARELYIGGLPAGVGLTANALRDFFNQVMIQSGLIKPGLSVGAGPVLSARMNDQGSFAFLEMRSAEETDAGMGLNGLMLMGAQMKIGRPKAYMDRFGSVPSVVAVEMINKGMVGTVGLPPGIGGLGGSSGSVMAGGGAGAPSLAALGLTLGAGINPAAGNILASMGLSTGGSGLGALFGSSSSHTGAAQIQGGGHGGDDASARASTDVRTALPSPLPHIPAILASHLAPAVSADMLTKVFSQFGELKQVICLSKNAIDGTGRTLVLFVDLPPASLSAAIDGLQGLDIGGSAIALSRPGPEVLAEAGVPYAGGSALYGQGQTRAQPMTHAPDDGAAATGPLHSQGTSSSAPSLPSAVTPTITCLELHNVVLAGSIASLPRAEAELELSDIKEDVAEECGRYGRVTDVYVPPLTRVQQSAGGEDESVPMYVTFATPEMAAVAANKMKGRKFEDRTLRVRFVSAAEFAGMQVAPHAVYSGVSIPPPSGGESAGLPPSSHDGAPEDGIALPSGPAAADID